MYTMEDFEIETEHAVLNRVTPEQLGAAIPAEKLAGVFPADKLVDTDGEEGQTLEMCSTAPRQRRGF